MTKLSILFLSALAASPNCTRALAVSGICSHDNLGNHYIAPSSLYHCLEDDKYIKQYLFLVSDI